LKSASSDDTQTLGSWADGFSPRAILIIRSRT
jgi:hypothetical protein